MKTLVAKIRYEGIYIIGLFSLFICFYFQTDVRAASFSSTTGTEEFVICVDAGHGGTTSDRSYGCQMNYDGIVVSEKDLVLVIANELVKLLSEYKNVKVVTTRTTDVYLTQKERVQIAKAQKADLLVSMHINSAGPEWAGPTVLTSCSPYQPKEAKHPDIFSLGYNVAHGIEEQLLALGMTLLPEGSNGVVMRRYCPEDGAKITVTNPDGSFSDYYGLIRYAKDEGIPAVIVEHAFLTAESDYRSFLSDEDKLKRLAEVDAKGIELALCLMK